MLGAKCKRKPRHIQFCKLPELIGRADPKPNILHDRTHNATYMYVGIRLTHANAHGCNMPLFSGQLEGWVQ